jgi:hypothetical protein
MSGEEAAMKMQASVRGHNTRAHPGGAAGYAKDQHEKHVAAGGATKIQAVYRGNNDRKRADAKRGGR